MNSISCIILFLLQISVSLCKIEFRYRDFNLDLKLYNSSSSGKSVNSLYDQPKYIHHQIFKPTDIVEEKWNKSLLGKRYKRFADPTFRGKPKTRQEIWHRNFNTEMISHDQTKSLIDLLKRLIDTYLQACIPIILFDEHIGNSEGLLLQRLLQNFPTTYIFGKLSSNYTLLSEKLLRPQHTRCSSYILFLADALMTRKVLGPQIDNRVIVVPRSTQWKLQEFLSSPESRDIVNLLVIGESYSLELVKEKPYVLYTHQLYSDGLGSNKPVVLTTWMNGRLSRPHVNLFPKKLTKGFAGHRFTIVAAHQPPYVFKRLSTDGVGNVMIRWDGLELRMINIMSKMMNFTYDILEPGNLKTGPGDSVALEISRRRGDIGVSGMYVASERNVGMEMAVAHSTDCAAFITLTSKALPRYRAILGPFQWPVWLALTLTYLLAIFPLAFSDRLSLKHLWGNFGEVENMFWYVFGTFTNSLTFSGEFSWSSSKKTSTRLLIGWYWVFTIIITACYTGSIIAFVTLPVFPETVDTVEQLNAGFYRVGTLDHGGWERWFLNSTHKATNKLLKSLEFVVSVEEGISNVTKAFFWPYAFIGSKRELQYLIQANFSDGSVSRRSALHISNDYFTMFGVSFAFQENAVYRNQINDAILNFQQSGLIDKLLNEVSWEMQKTKTGRFLQVNTGAKLRVNNPNERGLTLVDTEGMFLLMGIGFVVAGGVLISEWVGGCSNKCREILKERRDEKQRFEDEKDVEDNHNISDDNEKCSIDRDSQQETEKNSNYDEDNIDKIDGSRSSSICISSLNKQSLQELYDGPRRRHSTFVMLNGEMMPDTEVNRHLSADNTRKSIGTESQVSNLFGYLNNPDYISESDQYCEVDINPSAPPPTPSNNIVDIEEGFGEKV